MARKPTTPKNIPVDMNLLSKEDREALRKEARTSVLEEMKQDARDEYFRKAIEDVRREHTPEDQIVHVMIDIAPFLPNIMINGVMYFHGYGYDVPQVLAIVLYEQMQRSWQHQDEIDGRSKFNAYRNPQGRRIGLQDMGTTTRGVNGPVVAEV